MTLPRAEIHHVKIDIRSRSDFSKTAGFWAAPGKQYAARDHGPRRRQARRAGDRRNVKRLGIASIDRVARAKAAGCDGSLGVAPGLGDLQPQMVHFRDRRRQGPIPPGRSGPIHIAAFQFPKCGLALVERSTTPFQACTRASVLNATNGSAPSPPAARSAEPNSTRIAGRAHRRSPSGSRLVCPPAGAGRAHSGVPSGRAAGGPDYGSGVRWRSRRLERAGRHHVAQRRRGLSRIVAAQPRAVQTPRRDRGSRRLGFTAAGEDPGHNRCQIAAIGEDRRALDRVAAGAVGTR